MDDKELVQSSTIDEWDASFGRLLDLIPKSKKAQAFSDASFVEVVAKRWARLAAEASAPK